MRNVSRIPSALEQGHPEGAEQFLPLVYDELRRLAAHKLAREMPGQMLEATALVHETYLRLMDTDKVQQWQSTGHFFAAAAETMRRILVDDARRKRSLKAGGNRRRQKLPDVEAPESGGNLDLLALNEALEKLETQHQRAAEVVKLRFFTGLTIEETACALSVATSTVENDWAYARHWLRLEIAGPESA